MLGCTPECSTPVQDERACVSCCVSQSESSFGTGVRSGISNSDTYGQVIPGHTIYQTACMSKPIQTSNNFQYYLYTIIVFINILDKLLVLYFLFLFQYFFSNYVFVICFFYSLFQFQLTIIILKHTYYKHILHII